MKTQTYHPAPASLLETFTEEVNELNGTLTYQHISEETLFLRATLPDCREVKKHDLIQHGVAVRTQESSIFVHPYTFREICTNGAIHIDNVTSKVVEMETAEYQSTGVDYFFREAIRSCASPEAFEANLDDMRGAMDRKIHLAIAMSSMTQLGANSDIIDRIISRFLSGGDRTGFGLFNAITSTARDEPDPEEKWKLESVGGGIFALLKKPDVELESGYEARLPREESEITEEASA